MVRRNTACAFVTTALLLSTLLVSGCTKSKKNDDDRKGGLTPPGEQCSFLGLRPSIINGTTCVEGSSPLVTLLIKSGGSEGLRTGTMIKRDAVLSAAHCFESNPDEIVVTGGPVGSGSQRTTAVAIDIHPMFGNAPDGLLKNDVAVVKLARGLSLPTASIFASRPVERGDEIVIFGFGQDEEKKTGILKSGLAEVSDITQDNVFTESTKSTSNTCFGDSGGPAFFRAKRSDGQTISGLIGVTSAGTNSCAIGERSSYTNLLNPEVLDFVRESAPGVRIE